MGSARRRCAFPIVVVGLLLLPAALFTQPNPASESTPQPKTESSTEAVSAARMGDSASHARTVWLAGVIGKVMLKRPGSALEDPMVVDTPIQEGFRISSLAEGYAVVVFEYDSIAMMGQESELLFHQLGLDANGNRLTGMTFERGVATFHFLPQHHSASSKDQRGGTAAAQTPSPKGDVYQIAIAEARVLVTGKCRFRIDVKGGHARVEVFKGKLLFVTPFQTVQLTAGESLEHPLGGRETAFNIHQGIVKDPWDGWAEKEELAAVSTPKDASKRGQEPDESRRRGRIDPASYGISRGIGARH